MWVGIDGCRAGWIVATIDSQQQLRFHLTDRLQNLNGVETAVAYIDIPLGFAQQQYRACELAAQRLLGPKRSSVFLTPHKEAVYAKSFSDANHINKTLMGKGVSLQAWNIFEKVKEAVAFSKSGSRLLLQEAHPELCFRFLNHQQPVRSKKSSPQGMLDRIKIITAISDQYSNAIMKTLSQTKRKDFRPDDLIDATVLAIRAGCSDMQMVVTKEEAAKGGNIFY